MILVPIQMLNLPYSYKFTAHMIRSRRILCTPPRYSCLTYVECGDLFASGYTPTQTSVDRSKAACMPVHAR